MAVVQAEEASSEYLEVLAIVYSTVFSEDGQTA
jgi:hypothetical protein